MRLPRCPLFIQIRISISQSGTVMLETPPMMELDRFREFEDLGFEVLIHTPYHVTLNRIGLHIDFWPTADKWMTFGQTRLGNQPDLIKAVESGDLKMPETARQAQCSRCDSEIWWVKTSRGKNMPVNRDGGGHFNCGEKKPRKVRVRRPSRPNKGSVVVEATPIDDIARVRELLP